MSTTKQESIDRLKVWLDTNAYWREDLVIAPSKCGGLGVFFTGSLPDEDIDDPLLLRIPKSNVLAAKNSFIYNLVVEYEYDKVDLSTGMFGLILAVIYEVSIGSKSPWVDYLNSIEFEKSPVPVCLWSDADKSNFHNTEVDLLNLLKDDELVDFYVECCKFAGTFEEYAQVPSVLDNGKVYQFGQYVLSVISRAFKIDNYYDLAMVPGADLFNHIKPALEGTKVVGRENIHFICDGTVCEACGEDECDHDSDETDDDELSATEEIDEMEKVDEEESDSRFSQDEDPQDDRQEVLEPPIKEITLDYIYQMEQDLESEADTNQDPDEESTVSMSDDEDEHHHHHHHQGTGEKHDLSKELSQSSKCCDVVLIRAPSKGHDYEIFNSYGNELSNPYLFQRYGFITEINVNDTCLLSVQLFKYLKNYKGKLTKEKVKQLDEKFHWFENIGFDIVNQLVVEKRERGSCCEDNESGSGCCEDEDEHEDEHEDEPESWQLAPRIKFTGECTLQTYAILTLIHLPYTEFKHKILAAKKERILMDRISQIFIEDESARKKNIPLVKEWCRERISRYPQLVASPHQELILDLVKQEKAVLNRFISEN